MNLDACRVRVEAVLAQALGYAPRKDEVGNWPFDRGSARFVVGVVQPSAQATPILAVVSQLAQVPKTPELLELLNQVNAQVSFVRVYWMNGAVLASSELVAETVDPPELMNALGQVATIADAYDDVVRAQADAAPSGLGAAAPSGVGGVAAAPAVPGVPPPPLGAPSPFFGPR